MIRSTTTRLIGTENATHGSCLFRSYAAMKQCAKYLGVTTPCRDFRTFGGPYSSCPVASQTVLASGVWIALAALFSQPLTSCWHLDDDARVLPSARRLGEDV